MGIVWLSSRKSSVASFLVVNFRFEFLRGYVRYVTYVETMQMQKASYILHAHNGTQLTEDKRQEAANKK